MNRVRGYIFSRPFLGERVPQHVQNIVIRNYCIKNSMNLYLSSTEYFFDNSHIILNQTINDLKNLDGLICYSLFQLPYDNKERLKLLKKIIKLKKKIYFAVEELSIISLDDIKRIQSIWFIKKELNEMNKFDLYGKN